MGAKSEIYTYRPHQEQEREEISAELLNTAGHELNHALVAMALGAHVVGISVEPDGPVLGVTSYAGELGADQIKMIAVAGSLATHDGHAHGFGSDMQKAAILTDAYGGLSLESIKKVSDRVISSYPIDVREKAARMIVERGHVTGSQLKDILNKARMEVAIEQEVIVLPDPNESILDREYNGSLITKTGFMDDGSISYNYLSLNES